MSVKQYGVFGLGDFGTSVALTLSKSGCQVLAVDNREEHVALVADYVTVAVKADVHDVETIQSLDIGKLDGVIVCCGDDIGSNIMGIVLAKEADVPFIMTKAKDERTASIYKKMGANQIVFPERMMGERVAKGILGGKFLDIMELSSEFSIAEIRIPDSWAGKSLAELDVRKRYHVNVLARREGDKLDMTLDPMRKFKKGETYLIVGENKNLEQIR